MRYRKPFDDAQFDDAVTTHTQMRVHLRRLRQEFPPKSPEEQVLLQQYRDAIQDFGRAIKITCSCTSDYPA